MFSAVLTVDIKNTVGDKYDFGYTVGKIFSIEKGYSTSLDVSP